MSKKTVEKYKAVKQKNKTPVITPAEHRANCEVVADMLMDVIDRLPKDAPPVKETIPELLAQMDAITGRRETIIQSDGRRLRVDETGNITVIPSGVAGSVAVPIPESDTLPASTAEDENPTAKMITDMKRERFEKSSEKNFTAIDSSDAEKFLSAEPTLYTADELRILETFKDAEN